MIEKGIFRIPLALPPSLEPRRESLEKAMLEAQRRLKRFASEYGWGVHVGESFADRAEIFDDKEKFDLALKEITGTDQSVEFPRTFSAALEHRVLLCVSPPLYRKNYPEGIEEHAYEKLITHEMAHRLHIRILGGNEDAMGPIWFFEGFALFAAGQFEHEKESLTASQIAEVMTAEERGSYRLYAAVFRYFAKSTPVPELVEKARSDDFTSWLKEQMKKA